MEFLLSMIQPALQTALERLGLSEDESESLASMLPESPKDLINGDLAIPCFRLAGTLRGSPQDIATDLAEVLSGILNEGSISNANYEENSNSDSVRYSLVEVTSTGPFVNLQATREFLWRSAIENNADAIGAATHLAPIERRPVLIEHTSANPNGPFHVGRIRNAIIGDTMVRLERLAGADVTAEYYVDDMGKQVGILCWALENLDEATVDSILVEKGLDDDDSRGRHPSKQDHARVRWYQAANVLKERDTNVGESLAELILLSEEGDVDVLNRFEAAYQPVLDGMLESLARLGIDFDSFTKESRFILDGSVDDVVSRMQQSDLCETAENGALYLELADRGVAGKSTRFYFQRADGTSLYATRDIAYHEWKWSRADALIDILGEDHKLQAFQVGVALEEVGVEKPEVLFYAFTKLPSGKMSTRRANVVYVDDLIDEAVQRALAVVKEIRSDLDQSELNRISEAVAVSAVRFNIAKIAPEKGIEFRWADALSFDSDSAPFIQYSHARACSLRRKVVAAGFDADEIVSEQASKMATSELATLAQEATDLVRAIARLPFELSRAIEGQRPHSFCNALNELATWYNRFYRSCPVLLDGQLDYRHFIISEAARHRLRLASEAVGIIPLESM
jgi:arginyl-tRNA synthetase